MDIWYSRQGLLKAPLSLPQMKEIIDKILFPLLKHVQFVHQKGIIHRDITANNIIIVEKLKDIYPILIDWGVAKIISLSEIKNIPKPYFTDNDSEATGIVNQRDSSRIARGF